MEWASELMYVSQICVVTLLTFLTVTKCLKTRHTMLAHVQLSFPR